MNNNEFAADGDAGTFVSQGLYEPERQGSLPSQGSFVGQLYQPDNKESGGSFVGQFYNEPTNMTDNFMAGTAGEGEIIVEYEEHEPDQFEDLPADGLDNGQDPNSLPQEDDILGNPNI